MSLDRARACKLLEQCKTLADAEEALSTLTPIPSRGMRWGLFDGFSGRLKSLAGLVAGRGSPLETEEGRKRMALDYNEGWHLGVKLAGRRAPARQA